MAISSRPSGPPATSTRELPNPLTSPGLARDRQLARLARIGFLATTDFIALLVAGGLAYSIWALPIKDQSFALYVELAPLLLLFIVGYAAAGLYPGLGLGPVETLRRQSYVTAFGYLVLAAFTFALKLPHLYSRITFLVAVVLSLLIVPCARAFVLSLVRRAAWWREPVVIVGAGERAAHVIQNTRAQQLGYVPVAVIASLPPLHGHIEGVPIVGTLETAAALAARGIRVALISSAGAQDRAAIEELQRHFGHVVLLREYDDLPVEGIQIRTLGPLVGIEYTNNLLLSGNQIVKRLLDVVVAGCALVVAFPLLALAAVLVRAIDGSPVFFSQSRAGISGRRIRVPKIRTMRRDAEAQLAAFLSGSAVMREEWEARHKLRDDPRLIKGIGQLFRRFSVDELPQLWSVLRGDMSLVGPRPFPDYHLEKFSPSFLELRQRVRPGLTGLWQVEIRSEGSIAEQEAYDSYYIRNWSIWLDLYLLSRTIAAVAAGRGAY